MGMFKNVVAGVAGLVVTSVGTWNTLDVMLQAGTPSQPGQPSRQPRPSNPQPRPNNPQPSPENQNPQPSPGNQNPQPGSQDPIPDPNNSDAPRRGRQPERTRDGAPNGQVRYARPFAFQSPGAEGHFNLATRRLVQMEQRMQKSQEELLRSVGEARRLTGARQTEALFEIIQQMLKEQGDLQRYLIQSRTAWSGDLTPGDVSEGEVEGEVIPDATPEVPAGR